MLRVHTLAFLFFLFCSALAFALARVDLNNASLEQLKTLPGVGEATAESIMAARPFHSKEDLKDVKGIGEMKYDKLAKLVTVGETESAPTAASKAENAAGAAAESAKSAASSAEESAKAATSSAEEKTKAAMSNATGATAREARAAKKHLLPGEKININTASASDLARLPGIGTHKAEAIIEARPFSSPEDLMRVKGIKSHTFARIRDNITTE